MAEIIFMRAWDIQTRPFQILQRNRRIRFKISRNFYTNIRNGSIYRTGTLPLICNKCIVWKRSTDFIRCFYSMYMNTWPDSRRWLNLVHLYQSTTSQVVSVYFTTMLNNDTFILKTGAIILFRKYVKSADYDTRFVSN